MNASPDGSGKPAGHEAFSRNGRGFGTDSGTGVEEREEAWLRKNYMLALAMA